MTTITKLEQKTYQGKPSGFKVTLSDGTTGNLKEKDSTKGLREGDTVNVKIEPYTNKNGVTSDLIILTLASGSQPSNTSTAHAPVKTPNAINTAQMKFDGRMKCLELAVNCYIAGKIEDKDVEEHAKVWISLTDSLIDDIFTSK